jgi:hypothetical protein
LEDYNDKLIEVKNLVQMLPPENYAVLEFLMRHLLKVSQFSAENKMEPSNLAIVFGPSLLRTKDDQMQSAYADMVNMSFQNSLIESMIIQTEWVFDGSPK